MRRDLSRHLLLFTLAVGACALTAPACAGYNASIALCRNANAAQRVLLEELARAMETSLMETNCAALYKQLARKKELVLTKSREISDLTPLRELTHVTTLALSRNNITDLTPIAGMTRIKTLILDNNKIADISLLRKFKRLEELDLSDNPLRDLTPIDGLVELKTLFLNNIKPADGSDAALDLAHIARLAKLKFFAASHNRIADLRPLAGLQRLESLNVSYNAVQDLSPIGGLVNLRNLNVAGNQIADPGPLRGLKRLEVLIAAQNRIEDVSTFSGMDQLYELDISKNAIGDLGPLAGGAGVGAKSGFTLKAKDNPFNECSPRTLADLRAGIRCPVATRPPAP